MVKRLKLNEKALRDAEPKPGVSFQVFDTEVIGFAVRVQASGARTFTIDYRHAGRQRRMNIGRWPEWSVTAAHPDAEVIAATVAGIPDSLGGIRMAIQVAELARVGMTPNWMPGVVPRCVPMETKNNQHGERATTIVVGTERVKTRGKWRTVEVLACPVTWRPHPEQIASARRGYEDWWQALGWVRDGLLSGGMLREVELTAALPRMQPWNRSRSALA